MSGIRQRGDFGTDGDEAGSTLASASRAPLGFRQYKRSDVYLLVAVLTGLAVAIVLVFALAVVLEVGLGGAEDDFARPLTASTKAELPKEPHARARALLNDYPVVDG